MFRTARGFTLTEVAVATAILTTVSVGVAQMFVLAAARTLASRQLLATSALAPRKMEELRALAFTTAVTASALAPSPLSALDEDTTGFVDYFDAQGVAVDSRHSVFTRRWSIVRLTSAKDAIVVTVLATVTAHEQMRSRIGLRIRLPEDTVLVLVRTKRAP